MANEIKREYSKITVDEVRTGLGNTDIAILRQKVRDTYPAARGGNSMTDALFNSNEFGANGQQYVSDRVTFIKVPKGSTKEQVQAKLDGLPNARLYRVMSLDYKRVMTDEQIRSVEEGFGSKSYAEYEQSLRAKNPDTGEDLKFQGKPFYRAIYFSKTPVEDVDLRSEEYVNFNVVDAEKPISIAQPSAHADEIEFAEHSGQESRFATEF